MNAGPDPDGGLVTYRVVACAPIIASDDTAEGTLTLAPHFRTASNLRDAPLGIATLGVTGGLVERHAAAVPTAFSIDLFRSADHLHSVRIMGQLIRSGRTQASTQARFESTQPPHELVGVASATWAVIGAANPDHHRLATAQPDAADPHKASLLERFGVGCLEPGRYHVALSSSVGGGTLHHGPMQAMLEQSALDVAHTALDSTNVRIDHADTTLLHAGRTGPFVTRPELLVAEDGRAAVRVQLLDDGADGRLIATSVRVLRLAT